MHRDIKRIRKYAKILKKDILKIAHILMLRNFSAFLVLDYKKDDFRSFNSGSIDMRTKMTFWYYFFPF